MSYTAVVGLQWGDEGKGKVVDHLAADFDAEMLCCDIAAQMCDAETI